MKINGLEFAGVDIETTGSDIDAGAGICQIGVYLGGDNSSIPNNSFVSDIRPHDGALVTDEALQINGFTRERFSRADSSLYVDLSLRDWLQSHGITGRTLIAIGWNVGTFDLRFIKKFLPLTFELFSYRTIDLNAVCFTIDPIHGVDKLKKRVKTYAKNVIGSENWHDALYDAKASLIAWERLKELINENISV